MHCYVPDVNLNALDKKRLNIFIFKANIKGKR